MDPIGISRVCEALRETFPPSPLVFSCLPNRSVSAKRGFLAWHACLKANCSPISPRPHFTCAKFHSTKSTGTWLVAPGDAFWIKNIKDSFTQMTLHLPTDCANSHTAEVTWWPAGCLVLQPAMRAGQVPLCALPQGLPRAHKAVVCSEKPREWVWQLLLYRL